MSNIEEEIRKGEPIEKALKRLKKQLDCECILTDLRKKRYHEKPSAQKRKRNKRLAFNNMLRERYKDM